MTWLVFLFALTAFAQQTKVPDAAQFVGAPKGTRLTGEGLDRRTGEIASLLRCPVCQGLSVADSPSIMAANMKEQVRELLSRGYTEEQIVAYFERSYGEFVLLRPRFNGLGALVWILPLLVLLGGAGLVMAKMHALETKPIAPVAASEDPYVSRVRELVDRG